MVSREEAGDAYSETRAIVEDAACKAGEVGEFGRLLMAADHGTSEVEQQPELVFCRQEEGDGVGMLNSSSQNHGRCDIGGSCIDGRCASGHSEPGWPEADSSSSAAVDLGFGFGDRAAFGRYDRRAEPRLRSRSRSRSLSRHDSGIGLSLASVPEWESNVDWEDKEGDNQSPVEGEEDTRPPAAPALESRWRDQSSYRGSFSLPRSRTFSFDEGDDSLIMMYIKMSRIEEESQGLAESVDEAPPDLMI